MNSTISHVIQYWIEVDTKMINGGSGIRVSWGDFFKNLISGREKFIWDSRGTFQLVQFVKFVYL